MKSRIENKFIELKKEDKKSLITFISCGDPDLDTTYEMVLEMEKAGASIIELGVPFSDPLADGETIQRASFRALKNNVTINDCFSLVERLRKVTDIPLVFLTYFNPVYQFGFEKFINKCVEVGVDGCVVPDLPIEERIPFEELIGDKPFNVIQLVAPTSEDRIEELVKTAKGFIYCVSSLGVTGTRATFDKNLANFVGTVKKYSDTPVAIGFGISSKEAVAQLKDISDGVIVGSAIVEKVEAGIRDKTSVEKVSAFVKELHSGLTD